MKRVIIIFSMLLIGCDNEAAISERKNCLPLANEAELFSEYLSKNRIPHKFKPDEKCIYYSEFQDRHIKEAKKDFFGIAPPAGLSTSFVGKNKQAIAKLKANNIEFELHKYHGTEYISWNAEDSDKVAQVLEFSPEKIKMLNSMRIN